MRVLSMMSGGVDSSVTAYLLKKKGHEVTGITMKFYEAGQEGPGCCGGSKDAYLAKECARIIGIPQRTIDEVGEFKNLVMDVFTRSYLEGETPNPCVECNRSMKFGRILGLARSWGFDAVATGHYAKIVNTNLVNSPSPKPSSLEGEGPQAGLYKAQDKKKDQSYFLYMLQEAQLKRILFPLADLEKSEVRKIAHEAGLPTATKPESQDICFVGAVGGDYRELLNSSDEGEIIYAATGKVLGRHRGVSNFTVGQREGLGVAVGHPLYVTALEPATNKVYVGTNQELEKKEILVKEVSWVQPDTAKRLPLEAQVKIRYRSNEVAAFIEPYGENACRVIFSKPQRAPTPGQFAVFYDGDKVLGGGKIIKST